MIEMLLGFVGISIGAFAGYLDIALSFAGAFALLATATRNKSDDRIVQFILDAINFLGSNIGKAKNAVIVLALSSFVMMGSGCATIRPLLDNNCQYVGLHLGTLGLDLCDIPGVGPEDEAAQP